MGTIGDEYNSLVGVVDEVKYTCPTAPDGSKIPAVIKVVNWNPDTGSAGIQMWDVSDTADATNFNRIYTGGATADTADLNVMIRNGLYVKTSNASDQLVIISDQKLWTS